MFVLLSIFILGSVAFFIAFIYPVGKLFTASKDLSEESIGEFSLNEELDAHHIEQLADFEKRDEDNGISYRHNDFFIRTNEENEITSISMGESYSTSSGLSIGDSRNDVEEIYGEDYYTYSEMGLGDAMVYIDRENNIEFTIWTHEEHIRYIWLASSD